MKNDELMNEAIRNMRNRTTKLEREGDFWNEDDNQRLTVMFRDGKGISEMAVRLQRGEPAVYQQIERLDLYGRAERPRRRRKKRKHYGCCPLDPDTCARYGRCKAKKEGTEC